MTVELQLWHLITLLLSFFAAVAAFSKVFLSQVDRRLDERFDDIERSRSEARSIWEQRFDELKRQNSEEVAQWHRVERELLQLKAHLPQEYVRREDHIRFETVINAKLDAVNARLDLMTARMGSKA